jgi:hypothetical protein
MMRERTRRYLERIPDRRDEDEFNHEWKRNADKLKGKSVKEIALWFWNRSRRALGDD